MLEFLTGAMCPLQPSKLGHVDPLEKLSFSKKPSKNFFYKNPKASFYGPSKKWLMVKFSLENPKGLCINNDFSFWKMPIFRCSFLTVIRVVRRETTTIGKLEHSIFRLYPIYPYDGPTVRPEISIEKFHVENWCFFYIWMNRFL